VTLLNFNSYILTEVTLQEDLKMNGMQKDVQPLSYKEFKALGILMGLVAMLMAFTTLTISKIVIIGNLTTPGSTIWFLLITFPVMQIICINYNKKFAHFTIFVGWISMAVTTIMAHTLVVFPPAPVFEARNEIFNSMMTNSLRYFIAASVAYVATHAFGNEFFTKIKIKSLWLKSVVTSTIFVTVNTIIFIFAMFSGAIPFGAVVSTFLGTLVFRLLFVPVITLIVCVGSYVVRLSITEKQPAQMTSIEPYVYPTRMQRFFASFL
jgi:uncharacterized PurR-regulated membrane protein YhhQ (DUF165 family)